MSPEPPVLLPMPRPSIAIAGAIGFVGLVAPIFARRLTGGHPGRAIVPAALIGAILIAGVRLLARASRRLGESR